MPMLKFRLTSPKLTFRANADSDEWVFCLMGKCEPIRDERSFKIVSGDNSYDGFGIYANVHIKQRLPRNESPREPTLKPYDRIDRNRDYISVFLGFDAQDAEKSQPLFEVSVALPADAYHRVLESSWTTQTLELWVDIDHRSEALVYGNGPDGREIEWRTEKRYFEYLEEVSVFITEAPTPPDDRKAAAEQMLAAVERVTASIGALRATIIRAAWVLSVILIVIAFIK